MDQLALTICFIVAPLTLITRTVWPQLCTETVSHAVKPLSSVDRAIFKREWTLSYASILVYLLGRVVIFLSEGSHVSLACQVRPKRALTVLLLEIVVF
jgi:hypothetical protein